MITLNSDNKWKKSKNASLLSPKPIAKEKVFF